MTTRRRAETLLLIAIAIVTVSVTFDAGRRLGMHHSLSDRHVYYSIPYYMSQRFFGTSGYVILQDVAYQFIYAERVTNELFSEVQSLEPRPDVFMYFPGDDKGYADFAAFSFRLFGLRIESLYSGWFALFGLAVAAFVAGHWRDRGRLAALCVLLLAIYCAFRALPLTTQLESVTNPRSFGLVSLVSVLHLCLALVSRQPLTFTSGAAVAVQAGLIAFSIHVRSTEWWQVFGVLGLAAAVAVADRRSRRAFLWGPLLAVIVALAGVAIYQRVSVDRAYLEGQMSRRLFWHNVGIGFALNPTLGARYDLVPDDAPMVRLVARQLSHPDRAVERDRVFVPGGLTNTNFTGFASDYASYDRVAREVVASIVWNNRFEAIRTFVFDKPRVLARQLLWAMGYRGYSLEELHLVLQAGALSSDEARARDDIGLNVLRPWIWAAAIAVVWLSGWVARPRDAGIFALIAMWVCAISLLPTMIAYPLIHALGQVVATAPLAVFAMATAILAALAARWPIARRWATD